MLALLPAESCCFDFLKFLLVQFFDFEKKIIYASSRFKVLEFWSCKSKSEQIEKINILRC